jgi:predicted negative regulator of RcsB-dependent stress response
MDKQELRQDPIREKIIGTLTYLENNKNILFGVLVVVIGVIAYGGYYSSSSNTLKVESSASLGKALATLATDKDSGILLLSKVLEEGDNASKQVAMATLVNHYYSNEQFFEVDSLFNIGIKITDNILSSKLLTVQGDMRVNNEEYDLAIESYQGSINAVSSPEIEVKLAQAYHKAGNTSNAKKIVESLLENEKVSSTVKTKLNTLKSQLDS